MSDTNCPHCGACIAPTDHEKSGEYVCPECDREIWVEVEYEVIYTASCLDKDHNFLPLKRHFGFEECERCGKVRATARRG